MKDKNNLATVACIVAAVVLILNSQGGWAVVFLILALIIYSD